MVNENLNLAEYLQNILALRIVESTCAILHGNCRDANRGKRKTPTEINNSKLNERKTTHL